ncbi:hypothetical protein PIB30_019798 [Stylosanthes scabra]|uniref:Uncharacterized protein n=1 Tax=Stylosanthes scabra TaxID=79078 RepID=A0ABU6Z5S3_9FABA|nr:hypothetical protein [Stylosanthes scabra]
MEGTQFIHKFPIFDGNGDGYQWLILAEQFWNAQGTTEEQRFLEVENGLAGKALAWFRLWKRRNPDADQTVFDIAFMHRYQSDSCPILPPEISWNKVSDLDVPLKEIRAKCTDREATDAAKEEEEAISSSDASESYSDTRSTANSVAKVNAVAKEEGDDNDSSNTKVCVAEKEEHPDRLVANLDVEIPLSERGTSDSSGIMEEEKRRTTIRVDGVAAVGNDEWSELAEKRRTIAARTPVATVGEGATSMLGGWRRTQVIRRAMLLNPPPLMAAVFPWNRDKGLVAAAGKGAEDSAFAKGKVEDKAAKAVEREVLVVVAAIGSRTGLGEIHYREKDDIESGGDAWIGTEGKHSGGAWRMMGDNIWGYPCVIRKSFRVVAIGPVVTAAVDNIQHFFMGGNGCGTLKNKEELAERSGNKTRWTSLTLVDHCPTQFLIHPNSRSKSANRKGLPIEGSDRQKEGRVKCHRVETSGRRKGLPTEGSDRQKAE